MSIAIARSPVCRPKPPVPYYSGDVPQVLQFSSTLTRTIDETATTWTGVDLKLPHPDRVILFMCHHGANAAPNSASLNGTPCLLLQTITSYSTYMIHYPEPVTTGTFVFSVTGSIRKGVGVYVLYPRSPVPLEVGQVNAAGTSDAVYTDCEVQAGGCMIHMCGSLSSNVTFTTPTWSGVDTPVEQYDTALETASGFTHGYTLITRSSVLDDLTVAVSGTSTRRLLVASFAAPYQYG